MTHINWPQNAFFPLCYKMTQKVRKVAKDGQKWPTRSQCGWIVKRLRGGWGGLGRKHRPAPPGTDRPVPPIRYSTTRGLPPNNIFLFFSNFLFIFFFIGKSLPKNGVGVFWRSFWGEFLEPWTFFLFYFIFCCAPVTWSPGHHTHNNRCNRNGRYSDKGIMRNRCPRQSV